MSDTKKEGKRFRNPKLKGESPAVKSAVLDRHSWGSTEKILRRNRKLWTRLVNRRRRALGKEAIVESGDSGSVEP
jgi:hypothetical protein